MSVYLLEEVRPRLPQILSEICGTPLLPLDGNPADECTEEFMSLDRMDAVLGLLGPIATAGGNNQEIYPYTRFTCNGSISSWTFGAQWFGSSSSIELQIWRTSDGRTYTKVGSTTITANKSSSKLYQYPVSPPLPFVAGDILGYYQPDIQQSQLQLYFEENGRSQSGYYYTTSNASSVLNLDSGNVNVRRQVLIDVTTGEFTLYITKSSIFTWFCIPVDPPGCKSGFMSEERMRLILGLDRVSERSTIDSKRQQITPDVKFRCDGLITKWMIGADLAGGSFYPELQVWRNIGNNVYQKINGTSIVVRPVGVDIYENDVIPPIPFQAGDILGVLIPQTSLIKLQYERSGSPTNYYLTNITDTIDLEDSSVLTTSKGYPLVSVEIGE